MLHVLAQEEDATVPLQNALQLRNEQYRHLLLQKKKLDSDRRELASKVADQRRELHQLKACSLAQSAFPGTQRVTDGGPFRFFAKEVLCFLTWVVCFCRWI